MHDKLIRYFKIFFLSKYVFKLPDKREVLLYDSTFFFKKIISYYVKTKGIEDLFIRGEVLNLPIFFISLFSLDFFQFKKNYIKTYIKFSSPRIILTCTDNDMVFYTLKSYFKNKNINFIVLQNGLRGIYDNFQEFNDFKKKKKPNLKSIFFLPLIPRIRKNIKNILNPNMCIWA